MTEIKKTVGGEITSARIRNKMTQEALSEVTGISRSYISDIENDRYNPSLKTLIAIGKVLSMDLNFLTQMTEIQDGQAIKANTA